VREGARVVPAPSAASCAPPSPVVRARGLEKRYGTLVAVDRVTFEVRPGECFGFLGPNGAGKTTTMKMIYCVLEPSGGDLQVLGMDVRREARRIKARLGVVTQDNTLDSALSVRDNLVIFARYFDLPWGQARRRADELLEFVALADRYRDKVEHLSGGMRRRLMIARALMAQPDLLVLDEPTTGLDPQARQLTWEKLRHLKRTGVTQVLTTHYMDEAAALCDRLVIMDHGHIVAEGTATDLIREHVGREVVELRGLDDDLARRRALGALIEGDEGRAERHEVHGDLLLVYTADGEALLHRIREAALPIESAMLRRATLEDVFLKLTGRMLRE
jgi:lipooligosaccharide transport system ATP-binding protein